MGESRAMVGARRVLSTAGYLGMLAALVLGAGCASTKAASDKSVMTGNGGGGSDEGFARVRVFYGTDRRNTGSSDPGEVYDGERGVLEVGYCDVSIPEDHRVGELEAPGFWGRLFGGEDPEDHVVLLQVAPGREDDVFASLKRRIRNSPVKEAFVFVHGYNVTFEDAARRTAQIAYDVKFAGAPIFYSWPSQGTTAGYPKDETNVRWSEPHFKEFLEKVADRTDAERIHLVAHSMGNRLLTEVMVQMAAEGRGDTVFEEIILTAPDIDADIFLRDIAPRLQGFGKRRTLYVSSQDLALQASKTFHGYPRAGDLRLDRPFPQGMNTIDATAVDTSFVGHSYYGDVQSVIADLYDVIRSKPIENRFYLVEQTTPLGAYWRIRN